MSERGSFTTEYIYCRTCFEACKDVLCQNGKYLKGVVIPTWCEGGGELPIISGKIGGMWSGQEFNDMGNEYIPLIQEKMCNDCTIRIVVLGDSNGTAIYSFNKHEINEKFLKP